MGAASQVPTSRQASGTVVDGAVPGTSTGGSTVQGRARCNPTKPQNNWWKDGTYRPARQVSTPQPMHMWIPRLRKLPIRFPQGVPGP